jgi:hypothetical protein
MGCELARRVRRDLFRSMLYSEVRVIALQGGNVFVTVAVLLSILYHGGRCATSCCYLSRFVCTLPSWMLQQQGCWHVCKKGGGGGGVSARVDA